MPDLVPKTIDKHIGIEIECLVQNTEKNISSLIKEFKLTDVLTHGTDSSIESDDDLFDEHGYMWNSERRDYIKNPNYTPQRKGEPVEFRFISPLKDLKDNLKKVASLFEELEPYANSSCGLHVHLDMRDFSVDIAARNLFARQRDLFNAVKPERSHSDYADPAFSGHAVRSIIDARDTDHYHAISLDPYISLKTIEVRMHHGTVDCREIYEWAKLVSEIAYTGKLTKPSEKVLKERIATYGQKDSRIPNIIYNPLSGLYINETKKKAKRA